MSTFTVGGLSTGIDYNDLISKLMEVKRQPINILESKKTTYNDKISSYGDLSSKLSSLESAVNKLRTSANFYAKSVSVGDSTVLDATVVSTSPSANYTVAVTELASEEKEAHSGVAASTTVVNSSGGDKIFQYTYAGTQRSVSVADGTTLEGLRNLINDDADNPGVNASIVNDGSVYRLVLSGSESGSTNTITIDAGTTLDGSGGTSDFSAATFSEMKTGTDAAFSVDGIAITRSSNAVSDVISGMTFNLKEKGSTTTISVTNDVDSIKEQIEGFVTAYNDVMSFLSSSTAYDAATGERGVLSGEGTVRSVENRLRSIVSGSVAGQPEDVQLLAQIGITTDSETGNLEINSSTLGSKLASNLDDVAELFKEASTGVATEIHSYINTITSTVDGSITLREKGLQDVISNIDETIRNMEYRLDKTEADLVRRFSALEALVSDFTTTGNFLASGATGLSIRA